MRNKYFITMAGIACFFTACYFTDPLHTRFFPPCIFRKMTGLECPGCGTARALHDLAHGHIWNAFKRNILLVPSLLLVLVRVCSKYSAEAARLWQMADRPGVITWIVLLFWVLRNINAEPFCNLSSGI